MQVRNFAIKCNSCLTHNDRSGIMRDSIMTKHQYRCLETLRPAADAGVRAFDRGTGGAVRL